MLDQHLANACHDEAYEANPNTLHQSYFASPDWYHAMTLTERFDSRLTAQITGQAQDIWFSDRANLNLAKRRKQRWQDQYPFTNEQSFAQRLAQAGLSDDAFLYLLGEPIETLRDRIPFPPQWLTSLAQAFSHPAPASSSLFPEAAGSAISAFLKAITPLIRQHCDRLHQDVQTLIQTYSELPFEPNTIEDCLVESLPDQMGWMLGRTLILELHIARLQGVLTGDTPEERFQSFLESLSQQHKALAILREYPILARQLNNFLDNWVTGHLEFLNRLCEDWHDIRVAFSTQTDPGLLVALDSSVGDKHRGNRSVAIAQFSSGLKLVYKPKSLAADIHFQNLLAWLNQRGDHPPLLTQKILNRGTYGWVEYVEFKGCQSSEEIWRFYERQGAYLAILYALEATDLHSDNLIAAGEYPILIDLEALFHQHIGGKNIKHVEHLAASIVNNSVLRVGLLPQRRWSNDQSEGVDMSGLGALPGQLSPTPVPQWDEIGTDQMRLIRKRIKMPERNNLPTLQGAKVNPVQYIKAITVGFTKLYRLLLQHREDLLSVNGPLSQFAEDEVRIILRSTIVYASLLRESFHPDVLRNALDRDRLLDQLWGAIGHSPYLEKAIPAEITDLHHGDIPMFTTRPDSRDLWTSSGEKIENFFEKTGMALVHQRLQQLSEVDLDKQLWFIHASLATLDGATRRRHVSVDYPNNPQAIGQPPTVTKGQPLKRQQLISAAQTIGDRLESLALRSEDDIAWLGLSDNGAIMPLGVDLYNGLPGIAMFLAYLGDVTQNHRYTTLAQEVLTTLRRRLEQNQPSIQSIGAFNGWGGILYTLAHLGVLWDQPALLAEANAWVEQIPELIELDQALDIIGGSAGCIGSLLSLYHCTASDRTLEVAIQCGEKLIACAQPMQQGTGWPSWIATAGPLTGFSHGAAGIAWALLELAALTGEQRFRWAALQGIAYERSAFLPDFGNWPDLRDCARKVLSTQDNKQEQNAPHVCMTAWCHGAPGIGLARLRSLRHLNDATVRSEIKTALKTTLSKGFGDNHSLCHGDLGNLELLLQASLTLDNPVWKTQVDLLATNILDNIHQQGWQYGTPLGVEIPGLMTGLAGIGYGLMRLAMPERIPSVLSLESPKVKSVSR
ncbi:MAG: type 2 lanthipeptide synthetase LanM family protein [Cyanobacteria bacterium J06635_15]